MIEEVSFELNKDFIHQFRKYAYKGKLKEYIDYFDRFAHHFFIYDKNGRKIVGMFRILRNDEIDRFEIDEDSGSSFAKESRGVEISRLCTDPCLKGNSMCIVQMFKFMINYCKENNIEFTVAGSKQELMSFYTKVGFQVCGEEYIPSRFIEKHYPIILNWSLLNLKV